LAITNKYFLFFCSNAPVRSEHLFFKINMNIKAELLGDERQSKHKATLVARYASSSEQAFGELMDCFLSDEKVLAQRAAYSLGIASRNNPDLVKPYIGTLVKQLSRTDVHDAIMRNSARILETAVIPEEFHAELIDTTLKIIQDRQSAIAIRAFSLTILYNLSRIYPELKSELKFVIEDRIEFESAAFKSRARKILNRI
jgi:hypothetical protein